MSRFLTSLFAGLAQSGKRRSPCQRDRRVRPQVESLEGRLVMSTMHHLPALGLPHVGHVGHPHHHKHGAVLPAPQGPTGGPSKGGIFADGAGGTGSSSTSTAPTLTSSTTNADGSTTNTYSDGSMKQTMSPGTDANGPTTDVREKSSNGDVTETNTQLDGNGNPLITVRFERADHRLVKRTVTYVVCDHFVTKTEIWSTVDGSNWKYSVTGGDYNGLGGADAPPADAHPTPPK